MKPYGKFLNECGIFFDHNGNQPSSIIQKTCLESKEAVKWLKILLISKSIQKLQFFKDLFMRATD
jgi:hypothetical protein